MSSIVHRLSSLVHRLSSVLYPLSSVVCPPSLCPFVSLCPRYSRLRTVLLFSRQLVPWVFVLIRGSFFSLRLCVFVPLCLSSYQSIMQNKANFKIGKMTLNPCLTRHYGKQFALQPRQNKPKQTQFHRRSTPPTPPTGQFAPRYTKNKATLSRRSRIKLADAPVAGQLVAAKPARGGPKPDLSRRSRIPQRNTRYVAGTPPEGVPGGTYGAPRFPLHDIRNTPAPWGISQMDSCRILDQFSHGLQENISQMAGKTVKYSRVGKLVPSQRGQKVGDYGVRIGPLISQEDYGPDRPI